MLLPAQLHLTLPVWVHDQIDQNSIYSSDEEKVSLAIQLSKINVEQRSGGPFGAAVFDQRHRLIGVGVNRVVPQQCSIAHAEIMALAISQQRLQCYRLNQNHGPIILASSAQPCAMCFGALIWAGIDTLLIGARANDVEQLAGFDEGPVPENWIDELAKRGVSVRHDIQREQAAAVLRRYSSDGIVY